MNIFSLPSIIDNEAACRTHSLLPNLSLDT